MAKGKRKVPDINSSSTADIAFLLLIFFLITTSMDTDRGLARLLPPPPEDEKNENTDKIKERNILQVYLNKDDALMCGNDYIGVDQLRQKAKEFIANINNAENMPEKTQKNVDFFGTTLVNDKHVCGRSAASGLLRISGVTSSVSKMRSRYAEQVMSWL